MPQPLQEFSLGEAGHFEYRPADKDLNGIVVGVPHGRAEPAAVEYGGWIRDVTRAGLVIGYDFADKRIAVAEPWAHQSRVSWPREQSSRPRSVYPEFTKLLETTVTGPIRFYVGVQVADNRRGVKRIEVATSGFSFEQQLALKIAFARIVNQSVSESADLPKVAMAIGPLQDISWNAFGVRNHGVLMLAERGVILRLPKALAETKAVIAYRGILAAWVKEALKIAENRAGYELPLWALRHRSSYGRIDAIAARNASHGVVLGAPHGSFDWYTGELVEELSYRSKLPAVIARGFTPTECGGWRINVNRPSERHYPTDTIERTTERAKQAFADYSTTVIQLARGRLDLYIEMHQSGQLNHIDVAALGLSRESARAIKGAYREIRDRILATSPGVATVDLLIEPVDAVEVGAWAAKDSGVLKLAKTSLHFELPADRILFNDRVRRVYTQILATLINRIAKARWQTEPSPEESQVVLAPAP